MHGTLAHAFRCLLCDAGGTPETVATNVSGDTHHRLAVVRCPACAHVQLSPPAYDMSFYEADGQTGFVTGHYGTPIETLFDHSAIEARRRAARFAEHGETLTRPDGRRVRLLDIGGGYGLFGAAITGLRPDVETRVLEPSAGRAETGLHHLAARNDPAFPPPAFTTGLLDDTYVADHRGQYDVVTLWHVLEHVDDPVDLMQRAGALLRDDGTLWIEVPNLDDDLFEQSPAYRARSFMREHLSYFSAPALERLAATLFPQAAIAVHGYQRYGIFNYLHWLQHDAPQGARPDLWERDRWWLETQWRETREAARTSDALLLVVRMGRAT